MKIGEALGPWARKEERHCRWMGTNLGLGMVLDVLRTLELRLLGEGKGEDGAVGSCHPTRLGARQTVEDIAAPNSSPSCLTNFPPARQGDELRGLHKRQFTACFLGDP